MRTALTFILSSLLVVGSTASAKSSKKGKSRSRAKVAATSTERQFGKPQLGTEHAFNALDVNGRYQYPAESTVTVEDEKGITDLLGVRKHFKDRLAAEETRN